MTEGTDALQPQAVMGQMIWGYWVSQTVRAMAILDLADHLAAGPLTIAELASASGTDAPSLARLVRALSGLGLCARDNDGRVRLTPLGETLRSDAPGSMKPVALMLTAPWVQRVWEQLPEAVRTGKQVFTRVHGTDFWEYLATHPEEGAGFDAAMTGGSEERARTLLAARDMSGIGTVVDVGGGQGRLLAVLLATLPGLRGILADRPEVVAGAGEVLRSAGVDDRCTVVGGDFFASVPEGGDAYVLAQIIHDWPDDEALAILRTCHRAMAPGARLWVIEEVLHPGEDPDQVGLMLLDLNMLMCFGAQERTADEYRELLEAAGFGQISVIPTDTRCSVVEGIRL